jgi:hypothetical protein
MAAMMSAFITILEKVPMKHPVPVHYFLRRGLNLLFREWHINSTMVALGSWDD